MRQKVDFILQPPMTSSVVRRSSSSKVLKFPKAKFVPKSHGHCLVPAHLIHCSLHGILTISLRLRSTPDNSMRCTENCNACNYWLTEKAQFFATTTLNCTLHNQHFKSCTNWSTKSCFICHIHLTSHQPTSTSSRISTTLCREMLPQPAGRQKVLSKS